MKMFLPEGKLFNTKDNLALVSSEAGMRYAMNEGKILEWRVSICDANHNLIVELPKGRGIIPKDEGALGIKEGLTRDIALISRVSKPVCFTVEGISADEDGKPLYNLSRRRAQEICKEQYIKTLKAGDVIDVKITHNEPFGAFCDVGCGICSLIPIDCISVSRISHPKDRFYVGEDIKAVVKAVDDGRIYLSHKELLGTWEENANLISQGETLSGVIRAVEDYGCFVEIFPNLAGLAEVKEGVKVGQRCSVYVKNIIPEKMKVKLIIVEAFDGEFSFPTKKYFVTENHINEWEYSPSTSPKYIGTIFE